MIRKGEVKDFDAILKMAALFWKETIFNEAFDIDHTARKVGDSIDQGLLAVIDDNGVVGFCAGTSDYLLASKEAKIGIELAWWVDPPYRKGGSGVKLMKFVEDLARAKGIKYWVMVSMESSNPEAANKIYQRRGYAKTETSFMREL